MAEQEYPTEPFALATSAANDELPELDTEPTSLLSEARLEARYLDTSLLAANEGDFPETAALCAYPVDAFYQACQRHLQFGPSDATTFDPESDLVQDTATPEPSPSKTPSARRKGPSYAL